MDVHEASQGLPTRRTLLRAAGVAAAALAAGTVGAQEEEPAKRAPVPPESPYETQVQGIRIKPGQWRPHYEWEQIAWVSPSWPSQEYVWLDFPEAIFTDRGLLFLSHVNPPIPTVFTGLIKVPWREMEEGIGFDRVLPNGVAFGGSLLRWGDNAVDMALYIRNGAKTPLKDITLQTCAFLRGIKEFADYTRDNKFVHVPGDGWITLERAMARDDIGAPYRVGWRRSGKAVADLPVAVVVSNRADRIMAMSWGPDTLSLVGNPNHPCIHADPQFPDLAPGETGIVRGRLVFFEGPLEAFKPEEHFALERSNA